MLKLKSLTCCPIGSVVKKIMYRNFVNKISYKKTFQFHILNYFENVLDKQKELYQYEISTQVRESLNKIYDAKQKLELIYNDIHQSIKIKDRNINTKYINDIDRKCTSIINLLKYSEILSLLNALLKVFPKLTTRTEFYNKSMTLLLNAVEMELLNNHEIIHFLFFISLQKQNSSKLINYLKPYLPAINKLPLIEKCITAQVFYRSSLKLQSSDIKVLERILEEECECLITNVLLLVSLCKVIRISGPSSDITLKNLSNVIIKQNKPLNFQTNVHVLSLYAEALLHEPKAVDRLVKDSEEYIKNDYLKSELRLKDVDRFLWCISYLGINLTENEKKLFETYLKQRLKEYKQQNNLGFLVNSILCLHILGCLNAEVIKNCFEENIFEPIIHEKFHWKIRNRFQLLINQIIIEMKINVPHILQKQIKISYIPSKNINLVADISKKMAAANIIKNSLIECPINTLNIPGVTLFTDKKIYHIDVLDNSTCLKDTDIQYGFMKLKSRLLPLLEYQQILIKEEIFKEDFEIAQLKIKQIFRSVEEQQH